MPRIRNLIWLLIPLLLLVPLLVWSSVTLYQQTLRDVVSERDAQTARSAAAALTEQLERRVEIVQALAEQAAVSDDYDLLLEGVSFLDGEFDGGLAIFDLFGTPLAVSGVMSVEAAEWAIPATATTPFSPLQRLAGSGDPFMLVSALNESVQVVGAFNPTELANEVLGTVLSGDRPITAFIIDENGNRICTMGETGLELGVDQQYCVSEALAGNTGAIYPTDGDTDRNRAIAFSPVEPIGWALVTEETLESTANPRLTALLIAPLILVPIVLLALYAVWFGDRQVLRPLEQLEVQAAQLGQGQFEGIEAEVGGISAVRRLQSELVHMARRVQKAQTNLRTQVGAMTLGQEEERRRLARELHDDTIQSLIALNQRVQLTQLRANDDTKLSGELDVLQSMISDLINDVRRFTTALRPVGLEELGLIPALELLVENSSQQTETNMMLTWSGTPRRLTLTDEFTLYRITQEALNNVMKHANATEATVHVAFDHTMTTLTIEDNGSGFTVPANVAEMATMGQFGLLGIHERADLIGASVSISARPAQGTSVQITLPLQSKSA